MPTPTSQRMDFIELAVNNNMPTFVVDIPPSCQPPTPSVNPHFLLRYHRPNPGETSVATHYKNVEPHLQYSLPPTVLDRILPHLPCRAILALRASCKTLRATVDDALGLVDGSLVSTNIQTSSNSPIPPARRHVCRLYLASISKRDRRGETSVENGVNPSNEAYNITINGQNPAKWANNGLTATNTINGQDVTKGANATNRVFIDVTPSPDTAFTPTNRTSATNLPATTINVKNAPNWGNSRPTSSTPATINGRNATNGAKAPNRTIIDLTGSTPTNRTEVVNTANNAPAAYTATTGATINVRNVTNRANNVPAASPPSSANKSNISNTQNARLLASLAKSPTPPPRLPSTMSPPRLTFATSPPRHHSTMPTPRLSFTIPRPCLSPARPARPSATAALNRPEVVAYFTVTFDHDDYLTDMIHPDSSAAAVKAFSLWVTQVWGTVVHGTGTGTGTDTDTVAANADDEAANKRIGEEVQRLAGNPMAREVERMTADREQVRKGLKEGFEKEFRRG